MSAIHTKSLTGITSITTPPGVDNVFTVHSNDTTERFRVDQSGNQSIAGILTVSQDLDVDGHTNLDNVSVAGLTTTNSLHVAANNTTVGVAITQSGSGDILKLYDGTAEVFTVANQDDGIGAVTISSPKPRIIFNETNGSPDYQIRMNGGIFTIHDTDNDIGRISITSSRIDINNPTLINNDTLYIGDKLVHWTDDDTAIRFPSNDQISFETGGVDRGRFDNDGNFLIGTTGHGNAGAGARHLVISGPSNQGLTINSTNTSGIYRDCNIYFGYGTSTNDMAKGQFTYSGNGDYFHMSVGNTSYTLAKSFRLHSDGTVRFDSTPTDANSMSLVIKSHKARALNDNNGIVFRDANDHTQAVINVTKKSTSDASSDLVFRTSSGQVVNTLQGIPERLRITSEGNITTSSTVGHVLLGTDTARTINSHNGRLQVTGTSYSHSTMSIINNEANGNGAYIFLGKQRSGAVGGNTAVQANDIIGELRFPAGDGTDMENYAARIQVKADQNASSNNTSGYIDFYTTRQNGSSEHKMRMTQNSNHSHLFSMGTGTSHLNNCSTPDRTSVKIGGLLHLEGPTGHNATPGMYYNCYSGGNDLFYRGTGAPSGGDRRPAAYGQKFGGHYFYGDNSSTAWNAQQQITSMATNMQITSQGYVLKSNTPGFFQRNMNGAEYNNGQLKGGSNQYNTGNHYNTSTGIFTAPVAGRYAVGCGVLVQYNTGRLEGNISLNNSTRLVTFNGTGSTYDGPNAHIIVNLAANDTLRVLRQSGTAYPYNHDNHYFYAYLVG